MTLRFYSSDDFGAPTLTGLDSDLLDLFDACLVDGYGNQTISITSTGTTATIVTPLPHDILIHSRYTVSGADQSEYNGTFDVTVISSTILEYQISGATTSPATGVITGGISGAGWTLPYSDSSSRAYKQGAGSNGRYYKLIQNAALYGNIEMYENMTSITSVLNKAPIGYDLFLSNTTNVGGTDWRIIADEKTVTCYIKYSSSTTHSVIHFGNFDSFKISDTYNEVLVANDGSNYTNSTFEQQSTLIASAPSKLIMRGLNGVARYVQTGFMVNTAYGGIIGAQPITYPSPVDNSVKYDRIYLNDTTSSSIRGNLRGMYCFYATRPFSNLDIFDGEGDLAGKKFICLYLYSSGCIMVEISDGW